jgi:hypothetical protein
MWVVRLVCLLFVSITPVSAHAEYCWMIGCDDALGYVRIEPDAAGRPMPFAGRAQPAVGSESVLRANAYLRVYVIAGPLGKEDERRIATNGLLGSGTGIKVLEYVNRDGKTFAAVRVLSSENACPSRCGGCPGDWY